MMLKELIQCAKGLIVHMYVCMYIHTYMYVHLCVQDLFEI
jgi:hypothetical protein